MSKKYSKIVQIISLSNPLYQSFLDHKDEISGYVPVQCLALKEDGEIVAITAGPEGEFHDGYWENAFELTASLPKDVIPEPHGLWFSVKGYKE